MAGKTEIIKAIANIGKAAANKQFGKKAVDSAVKSEKAKERFAKAQLRAKKKTDAEKKAKDKKIESKGAGATGVRRRKKMRAEDKARAAYEKFQKATSKIKKTESIEDFLKRGGEISELPRSMQAFYRKEVEKELKGQTSRPLRELRQSQTDRKKRRQARKLTEGRETTEAFERRMAREAESGGVEDVGARRSQRGSQRDPLYEYERSQAAAFLRGKDSPQSESDIQDLVEMFTTKKKGGTLGRGMGKALRGGGKVIR
tara:strand:- start:1458 stop:2231 length:774 start_codon:yes stop_codon:yes gene_type:complete